MDVEKGTIFCPHPIEVKKKFIRAVIWTLYRLQGYKTNFLYAGFLVCLR
jgi:hypothetical protein